MFGERKLMVYFFLVKAVVFDVEEADVVYCVGELNGEELFSSFAGVV